MSSPGYKCSTCGQHHAGLALAWGANAPDALRPVPQSEWRRRVRLTTDECRLDRARFFVRGCLNVPIRATTAHFGHLVWVELPREAFRDVRSVWRELRGKPFPPYRGLLASFLPYSMPTLGVPVEVRWTGSGLRPDVVVHVDAHEVGREQQAGIAKERAVELASAYHHLYSRPIA